MNSDESGSPVTLGGFVKRARERAGFSLRNLEQITGISRTTLNRLELDQLDNLSPSLLNRLAEALELDSNDLFTFVGYRPSKKLPSLAPYLRAKYDLPPEALERAEAALSDILDAYDHEST
jgi:transcriptional regulator with XRE-family HTH domain